MDPEGFTVRDDRLEEGAKLWKVDLKVVYLTMKNLRIKLMLVVQHPSTVDAV